MEFAIADVMFIDASKMTVNEALVQASEDLFGTINLKSI